MTWTGHGRTAQHRAWRRTVLARDDWLCQINTPDCIGIATIADHIISIAAGGAEYDPDNGQAACHPCHTRKTQAEASAARPRRRRAPEPHPGARP